MHSEIIVEISTELASSRKLSTFYNMLGPRPTKDLKLRKTLMRMKSDFAGVVKEKTNFGRVFCTPPHGSGVVDLLMSMREAAIKCIGNVLVASGKQILH